MRQTFSLLLLAAIPSIGWSAALVLDTYTYEQSLTLAPPATEVSHLTGRSFSPALPGRQIRLLGNTGTDGVLVAVVAGGYANCSTGGMADWTCSYASYRSALPDGQLEGHAYVGLIVETVVGVAAAGDYELSLEFGTSTLLDLGTSTGARVTRLRSQTTVIFANIEAFQYYFDEHGVEQKNFALEEVTRVGWDITTFERSPPIHFRVSQFGMDNLIQPALLTHFLTNVLPVYRTQLGNPNFNWAQTGIEDPLFVALLQTLPRDTEFLHYQAAAVPEPSTLLLGGAALLVLVGRRLRK